MARTASIFAVSIAAALLSATAARTAEWPRVAGQGTDWVNSLSEPKWPSVAAEVERRFPNPFAFEVGARYWYSSGTTKFGFTNGVPGFGSPTSTLDWNKTQGHSGEIFGRIEHRPSSIFVKAAVGAGILRGGEIIDRDYDSYQRTWSDTTSEIRGDNLRYATVDIGFAYELPRYGVRVGGFVGYHYWHENMTAYGLLCNATDVVWPGWTCGPPGTMLLPNTAIFIYEPTWHAMRLGIDARIQINQRWSVSGEVAFIPIAWLNNKDSHLQRADLGATPNVVSDGWGIGGMAEVFVNYQITPNLEAGLGVRYWGINALKGTVNFGPSFNQNLALDYLDQSRYGVLAQIKGRF